MAELFAYMGWSIWYNRNAKRVGSSSLPMEKIYNVAIERLQEYHSKQEEPLQQDMVSHPTQWLLPSPSVYKINFDGVTFIDTDLARLEVEARDLDGMVIASLLECIRLPPMIVDLEALTCRRGHLIRTRNWAPRCGVRR